MQIETEEVVEFVNIHNREVRPLFFKDPNSRYLVRSAIQKAIRRGLTERALEYASYLYHHDNLKIFRDLCIIAIEDIGPGNLDAVYFTLLLERDKKLRESIGDLDVLSALVVSLSDSAIKSRAFCELSLGVDLFQARHAHQVTTQEFLTSPPQVVYSALKKWRGKMEGHKKSVVALQAVEDWITNNLTKNQGRLCSLAMDRAYDSMFLAPIPIVLGMRDHESDVVDDEQPPYTYIKGVESFAYDMHTRDGKIAIKAFHTHLKKRFPQAAVLEAGREVTALGSLIFILEGGLVNNRLQWPEMKEFQDRNFAEGYGVPKNFYEELLQLVKANLHVLDEKRLWSATLRG